MSGNEGSRTQLPLLYARASSGAITTWECWTEGAVVVVEWGQLSGAKQRATFLCTPKNVGRANATTAEQQAVLEATAKWEKQLKKKYFQTKAEAEGGRVLKPMLAKSFKDEAHKIKYPVDVQPKLDGVRCFAKADGSLWSRGGDPYNVPHITQALQGLLSNPYVLDGELYIHGESLQNTVSYVKRYRPGSEKLEFHVYDMASPELCHSWLVRKAFLQRWFDSIKDAQADPRIVEVQTCGAKSHDEVKALHEAYVRKGYEGAIIRLPDYTYEWNHRSSGLLKLKDFQDAEFTIIGYKVGKGKFKNVPIFTCVTADGKEFDATPRGTEEQRAELLSIAAASVGKQLTVRYFDLTDDGIPHFPVGVAIREPGT